jgi:O-antigen ligase
MSALANVSPLKLAHASSDSERWISISRGLELWLQHPIFGNGLGAFVVAIRAETGTNLVIHNSSVWMLAELGIAGFAIFAAAFCVVGKAAWEGAAQGETWARVLVFTLVTLLLIQMAHDVFYQRIFWLLMGATLFAGPWKKQHLAQRPAAEGAALPRLRPRAHAGHRSREAVAEGLPGREPRRPQRFRSE